MLRVEFGSSHQPSGVAVMEIRNVSRLGVFHGAKLLMVHLSVELAPRCCPTISGGGVVVVVGGGGSEGSIRRARLADSRSRIPVPALPPTTLEVFSPSSPFGPPTPGQL